MLESGEIGVRNQYSRSVTREGNRPAQELLEQVFEICDRPWRGIGVIPASGYCLRDEFADYDAERRFPMDGEPVMEPEECRAGDVLQGLLKPDECSQFGKECTPEHPLGAPMVSTEGACAAYFAYARTS
jgi:hydrogenase expression/formation protein HypD